MKLIVENLIKHKKRPIIFSRQKLEPKTNEPLNEHLLVDNDLFVITL
jgi:hypothetical protein